MCFEGECRHKRPQPATEYKMVKPVDTSAPLSINAEDGKPVLLSPGLTGEGADESYDFKTNTGKRLTSARKMARLSLEEASKLFGFTKQNLHRYEQGKYDIDSEMLVKFSTAYKLPIAFFTRKVMDIEFGKVKWHKLKRY